MKKVFLLAEVMTIMLALLLFPSVAGAKSMTINKKILPDGNLRKYISENYDKDSNGILSSEETKGIDKLDCTVIDWINGRKPVDFTGTEAFYNVKEILVTTGISNYDLSSFKKLKTLFLMNCHLKTLDVSKNVNLESLACDANNLSTLDIRNNKKLLSLKCDTNKLTKLDVSNNKKLEMLIGSNNKLSQLSIVNNKKLSYLVISDTNIRKLNIKNNKKLKEKNIVKDAKTKLIK